MTAIETPLTVPTPQVRVNLLRRLLKRPIGAASLVFLALIGVVAIFGPLIAPQDPNLASLQQVLAPPSADHLL
ncbi:hypothetical protein [Plantibacter sp. VKM Ac-2876]|nr:hypothetical protein [Plantibacter sp. VKM Ac-2876]